MLFYFTFFFVRLMFVYFLKTTALFNLIFISEKTIAFTVSMKCVIVPSDCNLLIAVVWPTAPRLVSLEAVLIWPAALRLTSHTCCVTDRYETNQCLLLLKVTGDTDTPLYHSGHRELPSLPLICGGWPFIKNCLRRYQHSLCRTSLLGRYQTAERLRLIQHQPFLLCR